MSLADARTADRVLAGAKSKPLTKAERAAAERRQSRKTYRRMVEVIEQRLTMSQGVTDRDLATAGFSAEEIATHFDKACRANRVEVIA